jgi:sulfate transport system substrate-binding protein
VNKRHNVLVGLAALAVAGGALSGCTGSADAAGSGSSGKVTLSLVAYSTPQAAYEQIIKAFQQTPQGRNVSFTQSYGASGDQSRAVAAGQPADVVEFSLQPDMTRLVDAGIVAPSWDAGAHHGFVTDSVVVIATRKGNPKHILDWPDLVKPGVQVVTPNPFTSGGARWNVMAAYGGMRAEGATDQQARAYLGQLFRHVPVQDDSARASLQTFTGGKGDALLSYENDAIFAQQNGQALDYTVPRDTILIQNPVAATRTSKHPRQAAAFVRFLYSDTAQKIFSQNGYRPVVAADATRAFPNPAGLFTIDAFGGWDKVTTTFFDPKHSVLATIENSLGVPTGK